MMPFSSQTAISLLDAPMSMTNAPSRRSMPSNTASGDSMIVTSSAPALSRTRSIVRLSMLPMPHDTQAMTLILGLKMRYGTARLMNSRYINAAARSWKIVPSLTGLRI